MSRQDRRSERTLGRRDFLQSMTFSAGALAVAGVSPLGAARSAGQPNVLFVFADEWRADGLGYAGNTDVPTPHFDAMARESINCTSMISGCPVCTPYRASLLTGQYWLTHGLFYNDRPLGTRAATGVPRSSPASGGRASTTGRPGSVRTTTTTRCTTATRGSSNATMAR